MQVNRFHYLSFHSSDENYKAEKRKQYREHIRHKQDNDYAYKIYNDPASAPDFLKYEAEGFNLAYPNWRNNPIMVHKLKQDTILARATGKINPGLFEHHSLPFFNILMGLSAIPITITLKKKNLKVFPKKSDTFNNIFLVLFNLLSLNITLDETSYIFTGKNFDKFLKDKFKKENKNKDS